ncbi:glucan endo-1,3-beta-glucosidase 7-like [Typha angustifolia]|uniref:glucan endo-1,3-beta-glucosidase 7-like n=1 Tax=Typha angustifolia TaxID=59011 RepID=UPI003C2B7A65
MTGKRYLLVILGLFHAFYFAVPQPFIGINYGEFADNLPPPSATASLLSSTTISKLRLYGTDAAIITALSGTGISILVGVANSDIPSLASSPSAASSWISSNLPSSSISYISSISVGNEVISSGDPSLISSLVPAMENLLSALSSTAPSIKISTVHSMAVLSQSDPPSSGAFHPDLAASLDPLLAFLQRTGSPFMVNPYPWFAYSSDPRPETLAFCLFQPNPNRVDSGSGLTYTNMFDAQLDAIRAALDARGFPGVDIVVAETGWPYKGDPDEPGATVDNARAYVGNLVAHLRSMVGTPRVPGKSVDTYLFALYDEDLKPGPTSERSFGLYHTDLTPNYDAGLSKVAGTGNGTTLSPAPAQGNTSATKPNTVATPTGWCATNAAVPGTGDGRQIEQHTNCYLPSAVGSWRENAYTWVLCVALSILWNASIYCGL